MLGEQGIVLGGCNLKKLSALDRFFKLTERGTTVNTEIIAGFTTFVTLAYIILVNPNVLSEAGIPKEAAIAATILATVGTTLMVGLIANLPMASAPGLGLQAFFTYTVVIGMGLTWQTALGAVFVSGVVFFILTITGALQYIVKAIPEVLKISISVGIGLFIAFIGLRAAGVVVADPNTLVAVGDLTQPAVILSLLGVFVAAALMSRNVKGGLLIAILGTTAVGMLLGIFDSPKSFSDVFSLTPPKIGATFCQLDLLAAFKYGLVSIVFSFTIVEMFDNIGTLIGLTRRAGLVNEDGSIPNLNRFMLANSLGTMWSAIVGTCTVTTYVENAAGITEGGRTGLTAVVVAILFALTMFFAPLVSLIPSYATAPALIIIGALMLQGITDIDFTDFSDALPAFLTIILMPLTYNIAQGIAFGFISYAIIKPLTGKAKEVHWLVYIIAIVFVINFALRLG
ncbi:MAG TPA: NCS2 family permease [Syntrophomonadaceae bacterium]|nr:NCS2 family permease [Syntrophomonadaceae bacterium]